MISLLMVCTGNICRSAYAERLLQHQLDEIAPGAFVVRSAGTQAMVGRPMEPSAAQRLILRNGSDMAFMARQLSENTLAGVDFVLAMTEDHRTAVVAMSPKMLKRAYTIREFAAVLDAINSDKNLALTRGHSPKDRAERWSELRATAVLKRHEARMQLNGKLDINDPYRRGDAAFDTMVLDLAPLLDKISHFEKSHA